MAAIEKLHIVWNDDETQGYVTKVKEDALDAATGTYGGNVQPMAKAFIDNYWRPEYRKIQEVIVVKTGEKNG